jgi:hypothetical protein
MKNHALIIGALSIFLCGAAMAQHGGTEQEQRSCAGNVQRYCRPILDQGDFAVLACLQKHRQKLTVSCKKSSRIMVSDRTIRNNAPSRNDPGHRRFT